MPIFMFNKILQVSKLEKKPQRVQIQVKTTRLSLQMKGQVPEQSKTKRVNRQLQAKQKVVQKSRQGKEGVHTYPLH